MENLTSPFIDPKLSPEQQTEAFVGLKTTLLNYKPDPKAPTRVPFTIVESANELFPDYQPHNNSVFSIHDDLGYGINKQITEATLNYLVVGFHGRAEDDPLTILDSVEEKDKPTYGQLLKACVMEVGPGATVTGDSKEKVLETKADFSTRIVCHGTIRNIPFQRSNLDLQAKSPAVRLQDLVRKNHPVAIGTNTLDALLAYLRVQYADDAIARNQTDQMLNKIVQLIASNDSIDAQQKAEDQISTNDWVPIASGNFWTMSNADGPAAADKGIVIPSDDDQEAIMEMNDWEACIAGLEREKVQLYQKLFWRWWNAMEVRGTSNDSLQKSYKDACAIIVKELRKLDDASKAAETAKQKAAAKTSKDIKLESVSAPLFGTHQDPTILFAGVSSGWPKGFENAVKVRLASQMPQTPDVNSVSHQLNITDWDKLITQNFSEYAPFIRQLLPEALGPKISSQVSPVSAYVNEENFDDTQGWFPLFIEWEVEYHHIKFEHWEFQQNAEQNWCYKLRTDKTLLELPGSTDCRSFSGRTPIVPQASSALKARLKQLFARARPEDQKANATSIIDQASLVEYFSAPLAGIKYHLMTLIQGTHIRPHKDDQVARDLGLSASDLEHLIQFSDKAPYGRLAQLRGEVITAKPFKPVTHGQFIFTKLHIIDKFGQVISCVEPSTVGSPRTALYPCASPQFFCDPIPKSKRSNDPSPWPNTAYEVDDKAGLCQFFQVPPRINQDARLNATFVVEDNGKYHAVSQWENPIWGWIIVNNLDKSLQIFNEDGFFVREIGILFDPKSTTIISPPGDVHGGVASKRLLVLLRNLESFPYALGLFNMLEEAYQATSTSTAEHAGFLPAAFGQAFCLADFGLSIELAAPVMENQSLQYPNAPDTSLENYKFRIGLGNADAGYDGLAGYFEVFEDLDIESIYSAFGDEQNIQKDAPGKYPNPIHRTPPNPLELSPYYVSALTSDYVGAHHSKLVLRSAIFDPMRSLHVYTGGLFPTKEVVFPKWAVGLAMSEMHAYFSAGPLLVPYLPAADEVHTQVVDPAIPTPEKGVQMPVSGLDAWSWLQARSLSDANGVNLDRPGWSKYPVRPVDGNLDLTASGDRSEFVEGFFLMRKTLQEAAKGAPTR